MRFRKLRIAWSVGSGIACVLLIVLWVRSYSHRDLFGGMIWQHEFVTELADGNIALNFYYLNPSFSGSPLQFESYRRTDAGYGIRITSKLLVRAWPLVLLFAVFAATPWLHWGIGWRFSLRTLLIATTLVAVVLG
jgi:hypothetical protein